MNEKIPNLYINPPYRFYTLIFSVGFLFAMILGSYMVISSTNLIQLIIGIICIALLDGTMTFCLFTFIILRPINIQINNPGIILYYHHRKPVYVPWDAIEFVSRYDTDSLFRRIDRMGKMKVRFQKYPFFMPFDVAKAIMDAYKGSGQIRMVGKGVLIKN